MPITVDVPGKGAVEFPDGTPPEVMEQALAEFRTPAPTATAPAAPSDTRSFGQKFGDAMIATGPQRLFQRENLPMTLGAVGAAALGPLGFVPAMAGAGYGGAAAAGINALREGRMPNAREVSLETVKQAAMQGVGAAGGKALEKVGEAAVPMVRSALKMPLAYVKRRAGIEGQMVNQTADEMAQFIVENQLRTPEQAQALIKTSGQQVDDAITRAEANPNVTPLLDTATRIPKAITGLMQRIDGVRAPDGRLLGSQILPAADRNAVAGTVRELLADSPLTQNAAPMPIRKANDVLLEGLQQVRTPAGTGTLRAPGPPTGPGSLMRSEPGARALRANVRPSEGMSYVRNKSFFNKDAAENALAGGRTIEKAVRDSVKDAVPETAAPLKTQGRAMDAREVLDRAAWRDAGRDTLGMGGLLGIANGRPLLGMLLQLAKEGQLGAGLLASRVARKAPQVDVAGRAGVRLLDRLLQQDAGRPDQ